METLWSRWTCGWMCRHRGAAARLAQWMRPDLPPEIARDGVQHSWVSYSRSFQRLMIAAQADRDIAATRVPVQLVAGEDDPVVDGKFLRELVEAYGHVRLEWWAGGHDLPLTDPDRCMERLQAMAGLQTARAGAGVAPVH